MEQENKTKHILKVLIEKYPDRNLWENFKLRTIQKVRWIFNGGVLHNLLLIFYIENSLGQC